MSLNLTNLFTAIGRCGRNNYLINTTQALQPVPFNELAGYAYINPEWIVGLTSSYDSNIRTESQGMFAWQNTAQSILLNMVAAQVPTFGTDINSALYYLMEQMIAQSATVQSCSVGSSVTAFSTNIGTGNVVVTLTRGDGTLWQNIIPESTTLTITNDSYTGGATQGLEGWSWQGVQNNSSLATGVPVGQFDWDYPQGSGGVANGNAVSASDYADSGGNLLTNGDFANWTPQSTSPTAVLNNFNLVTGTWGTDVQQSTTAPLSGTYCLEFLPTAVLTHLTQQFNSSSSSGSTAGTTTTVSPSTVTSPGWVGNFYLKASASITGHIRIALVDGSNTVINDQSGTANSVDINLNTVTTSWVAHSFNFRLPTVIPSTVRLDIKITTAVSGGNLFMDWLSMAVPTSLYIGGPALCVFSNPAAPYVNGVTPDGYTVALSNDKGGATYWCANWQNFFWQLFQNSTYQLPYSGSPTIANTLITGA